MKLPRMIVLLVSIGSLSMAGYWYSSKNQKQIVLKNLLEYKSRVHWLLDSNPSTRKMEAPTRESITADYTNAWKQQSIALFLNDTTGLYSFFVPNVRQKIRDSAENLSKNKVQLIQNDSVHVIQLKFYSLDGQVVSMTDSVVLTQQIDGVRQTEKRLYEVLLLLEEGHWRVKNWTWEN